MAKKKTKWIQSAQLHEGALTAKAQAAGKTIAQFCAETHKDAKTNKQCQLAKTFAKMRKS